MTIAISSRVNDPRSAQQIAVLLVTPLAIMLVGQISGAFVVTTSMLLAVAFGLAIIWLLLIFLSVAIFDRETILTRWK
jgi:ABC-2 type transport system permease protein